MVKVLVSILLLLPALYLTDGLPIPIRPVRNQQSFLSPQRTPSTGSSCSSSSTSSNGLSGLKSLLSGTSGSAQSSCLLQCQVYNPTSAPATLTSLVATLNKALQSEIDTLLKSPKKGGLFGSAKKSDEEMITFDACLAGYTPASAASRGQAKATAEESTYSPAIMFNSMSKRQLGLVKAIIENRILPLFPKLKVVRDVAKQAEDNAFALVIGT